MLLSTQSQKGMEMHHQGNYYFSKRGSTVYWLYIQEFWIQILTFPLTVSVVKTYVQGLYSSHL